MHKRARRAFILARDRHTCQYCLAQPEALTLDHVVPKSVGGLDRRDNLVACCENCNDSRRDMEFTEWCGVVAGLTGQNVGDILGRIKRQLDVSGEYQKEGLSSKEQMKRIKGI